MRIYFGLFFSVLVFLTGCSGSGVPDGVIKEQTMTGLLTELHILDGGIYNIPQSPDSLYKYGTQRYLKLFKKFHTDSAQFRKSYKFYTANPELLTPIYDQVMLNLKTKLDSLSKVQNKGIQAAPGQPNAPHQPDRSTPPVTQHPN
jgi:hypothetical protein